MPDNLEVTLDQPSSTKPAKRKSRAKRMSPEQRRQQILGCAVKAFATNGITNTTHADVAKIAKVSNPTVFHYFPTIEQLQREVFKDVGRFMLDGFVTPRMTLEKPGYEIIEEMLIDFRDAVTTHPEYIKLWLEWSGFSRDFIWTMYLEFYDDVIKSLRKLIIKGRKDNSICSSINAGDAARIILGMAHTVAHMSLAGSSSRTVHGTVHSIVMAYLSPR